MRWLSILMVSVVGCPTIGDKDIATDDADWEDNSDYCTGDEFSSDCSWQCGYSRLACALSSGSAGARCFIQSCVKDADNCAAGCNGTCGWADKYAPNGCSTVAP
ncbi:MAG: hypothetical protein HOP09_14780 [Hyphomicrobium sp.]|nr:hypothetical protein [Hyphomicrobium sp.]